MTSDFQNYLNYLNIILRKQNLLTFTYLKKESLDLFDLSDSALFEVTSGVEVAEVAVQPRLLEPVAQPRLIGAMAQPGMVEEGFSRSRRLKGSIQG